jgi:hypothetical protein
MDSLHPRKAIRVMVSLHRAMVNLHRAMGSLHKAMDSLHKAMDSLHDNLHMNNPHKATVRDTRHPKVILDRINDAMVCVAHVSQRLASN